MKRIGPADGAQPPQIRHWVGLTVRPLEIKWGDHCPRAKGIPTLGPGFQSRSWQIFSVKSQRVNILDFVGHMVSVVVAQKTATDKMQTNGQVPIKLRFQNRATGTT